MHIISKIESWTRTDYLLKLFNKFFSFVSSITKVIFESLVHLLKEISFNSLRGFKSSLRYFSALSVTFLQLENKLFIYENFSVYLWKSRVSLSKEERDLQHWLRYSTPTLVIFLHLEIDEMSLYYFYDITQQNREKWSGGRLGILDSGWHD